MIASFSGLFRSGARTALDAPVAALAGLSVAFLAFAAPADLVAGLVDGTGLPSLIPAVEPPLGVKARILLAAAGATGVFTLVFLLLRSLDRAGRTARHNSVIELGAPRLRRRDLHPDAPPRPPILAGTELGEPIEDRAEPMDLPEPIREAPLAIPQPSAPDRTHSDEAIPDLMKRLEQGLARRRTAVEPTRITDPPEFENEPGEDRLQGAIESLRRLAARQY